MMAGSVAERRVWGDTWVVGSAVLLACLGLLSVFASTGIEQGFGGLRGQSQGLVLGIVACVALAHIPARLLIRFALVLALLAAALFVLTLFTDIGVVKNGARRSMRLGPIFLMPAELAKPALVLLAASMLTRWGAWSTGQRLASGGVATMVLVMMVMTKDLGTPLVITMSVGAMWFLSGAPLRWVFGLIGAGVGGVLLLIQVAPHRMRYVRAWLDPFCEQVSAENMQACMDASAALRASFSAIRDGGLVGRPLGGGEGPLHLLEGHNDFIGAVVAEQFGLIGLGLLTAVFVIIIARGLMLAHRAADPDIGLTAAGCATMIGLQGLVHLAVITGTIPPKGLTLPLVSVGTSSLVATGILVGMLLSIGREQAEREH